jgi:hypothetical protein
MGEILFYGNCQMNAVKETLKIGGILIPCHITTISKEEFTSEEDIVALYYSKYNITIG